MPHVIKVKQVEDRIKLVGFDELYTAYLEKYPIDGDVIHKNGNEMFNYTRRADILQKWDDISKFLMGYAFNSKDTLLLSMECVYRSIVGDKTAINALNKFPVKQENISSRQNVYCKNCEFKFCLECDSNGFWRFFSIESLELHSTECFQLTQKRSKEFMKYIDQKYGDLKKIQLNVKVSTRFNVELDSHVINQRKYSKKKKQEREMIDECTKKFLLERFTKSFGLPEGSVPSKLDESIKSLFGLLTSFKEQDKGFDFKAIFTGGILGFLGLLWSSQKALLGLYGDLLIVDSIHGFTNFGYHVINVTIVDSNLKSQFGAIAIVASDCQRSYETLFQFIKDNVNFLRPPKALIADGAMAIHNGFDSVFPGGHHIFCSYHLETHISQWVAGAKEKSTLTNLIMDGIYARNLNDLEITKAHIEEMMGDVKESAERKINNYLELQPPCLHNFFTARSTASGRCEKGNSILRQIGFTNPGCFVKSLELFRDTISKHFESYIKSTFSPSYNGGWMDFSLFDEKLPELFTKPILEKVKAEYEIAKKGYQLKSIADKTNTYQVSYNGDAKDHLAHEVCWMTRKNTSGSPVVTCTCSLHASGGYPCRHIISVALERKEKITQNFFNDRMMKSQGKFLDGSSKPMENYCHGELTRQLDLHEPCQTTESEFFDRDTEDHECSCTTECDGISTFSKEKELFMSRAQKTVIKSHNEIIWNPIPETTATTATSDQTRNNSAGVKRTRLTLTPCSNDNEGATTSANPTTTVYTTTNNPGALGNIFPQKFHAPLLAEISSSITNNLEGIIARTLENIVPQETLVQLVAEISSSITNNLEDIIAGALEKIIPQDILTPFYDHISSFRKDLEAITVGAPVNIIPQDIFTPILTTVNSSLTEPPEKRIKFSNGQLTYSFSENSSVADNRNTLYMCWHDLVKQTPSSDYGIILDVLNFLRDKLVEKTSLYKIGSVPGCPGKTKTKFPSAVGLRHGENAKNNSKD